MARWQELNNVLMLLRCGERVLRSAVAVRRRIGGHWVRCMPSRAAQQSERIQVLGKQTSPDSCGPGRGYQVVLLLGPDELSLKGRGSGQWRARVQGEARGRLE